MYSENSINPVGEWVNNFIKKGIFIPTIIHGKPDLKIGCQKNWSEGITQENCDIDLNGKSLWSAKNNKEEGKG